MSPDEVRRLLAEADRERRIQRGAESARVNIRLGRSAVVHRKSRVFGWVRDRSKPPSPHLFERLEPGVEGAMYRALGIVSAEAREAAEAYEARAAGGGR